MGDLFEHKDNNSDPDRLRKRVPYQMLPETDDPTPDACTLDSTTAGSSRVLPYDRLHPADC